MKAHSLQVRRVFRLSLSLSLFLPIHFVLGRAHALILFLVYQKPSDKRYIMCDDKLFKLFGVPEVSFASSSFLLLSLGRFFPPLPKTDTDRLSPLLPLPRTPHRSDLRKFLFLFFTLLSFSPPSFRNPTSDASLPLLLSPLLPSDVR